MFEGLKQNTFTLTDDIDMFELMMDREYSLIESINQEDKENSLYELNQLKQSIEKYGYTESLESLYSDSLSNLNISGSSGEIVDQIDNILINNEYVEISEERIHDVMANSHFLLQLVAVGGVVLFTGSFLKIILLIWLAVDRLNSWISAIEDIEHYKNKIYPTLDKEQIDNNIKTRKVRTLPKKELYQRLKPLNVILTHIADVLTNGKQLDPKLIEAETKAAGLKFSLFGKIKDAIASLFKFTKLDTIEDHGYDSNTFDEIYKYVTENKKHVLAIKLATGGKKKIKQKNIELKAIEGLDDKEVKEAVNQLNRSLSRWNKQCGFIFDNCRRLCKQIVYTSGKSNLMDR